ncbi:MAG: benzoyl-CoA 2,3-epoxidase subunit BoxB, partial [Myxococcota bacterium]
PALTAVNMRLRDDYVKDAAGGVGRWNKIIAKAGIDFEITLPSTRFHRETGIYAGMKFDPSGRLMSDEEWEKQKADFLPTEEDEAYIKSLMTKPIFEPGKMANWIAAPRKGVDGKPVEYEYVRL